MRDVLRRPKFASRLARDRIDVDQVVNELSVLAEVMEPPPLPHPVARDPHDDKVLALAAASRADVVISGDADLLVLGKYSGIPNYRSRGSARTAFQMTRSDEFGRPALGNRKTFPKSGPTRQSRHSQITQSGSSS